MATPEYIELLKNGVDENKPSLTGGSPASLSPEPSHIKVGNYVTLMETNGKECESWYYFIRREGNIDSLQHLYSQLEQVNWYIVDDLSTFDLDLEHLVTSRTAKQMTKLELNSYAFHRKFDGKLNKINLGFRSRDKNEKKICKTFDLLGYGQIEDYISDEDLDAADLTDADSSSESESSESDDTEDELTNSSETEDNDTKECSPDDSRVSKKDSIGIPPALLQDKRPRWAKAKGRRNRQKRK